MNIKKNDKQNIEDLKQQLIVLNKKLSRAESKLITSYEETVLQYQRATGKPSLWKRSKKFYSKYSTWFIIPSLLAGIFGAKFIPIVQTVADVIMSNGIDFLLEYLAPLAIFLVLAPAVAKMLKTRKESKFAGFVMMWFTISRLLAAIWAAIFVSLVLGLPLVPEGGGENFGSVILKIALQLKELMLHSIFFQAMWVSIIIGVIGYFYKPLGRVLYMGSSGVEAVGEYIEAWIPFLAFLIGSFIYGLPKELAQSVSPDIMQQLSQASILGMDLNLKSEFGLIGIYFIEAALIGLGCFIWQIVQLIIVKKYVEGFSIKEFFTKYWIKVYPLAWSTASEAVSMPLNLAMIKKQYKGVKEMVRKLVVGLGAYLNINGTAMDVMVLTGVVSLIVGHPASLFGLILSVPVIALIGFGVPGIAGEAVLFAVPMMTVVGIPPELTAPFMAIFIAIQLGLPDSFRTGANVTDNGIYAIWLNKIYEKRFQKNEEVIPEASGQVLIEEE